MESKVKKILDENNIEYSFYNRSSKDNKEYRFEMNILGVEITLVEFKKGIIDLQGKVINGYIKNFNIDYILSRIKDKNISIKKERLSKGSGINYEKFISFARVPSTRMPNQ